jgi:hypothetical protein
MTRQMCQTSAHAGGGLSSSIRSVTSSFELFKACDPRRRSTNVPVATEPNEERIERSSQACAGDRQSDGKSHGDHNPLAHSMTVNELAPRIFVTAALLAVFLFFTVSEE